MRSSIRNALCVGFGCGGGEVCSWGLLWGHTAGLVFTSEHAPLWLASKPHSTRLCVSALFFLLLFNIAATSAHISWKNVHWCVLCLNKPLCMQSPFGWWRFYGSLQQTFFNAACCKGVLNSLADVNQFVCFYPHFFSSPPENLSSFQVRRCLQPRRLPTLATPGPRCSCLGSWFRLVETCKWRTNELDFFFCCHDSNFRSSSMIPFVRHSHVSY